MRQREIDINEVVPFFFFKLLSDNVYLYKMLLKHKCTYWMEAVTFSHKQIQSKNNVINNLYWNVFTTVFFSSNYCCSCQQQKKKFINLYNASDNNIKYYIPCKLYVILFVFVCYSIKNNKKQQKAKKRTRGIPQTDFFSFSLSGSPNLCVCVCVCVCVVQCINIERKNESKRKKRHERLICTHANGIIIIQTMRRAISTMMLINDLQLQPANLVFFSFCYSHLRHKQPAK